MWVCELKHLPIYVILCQFFPGILSASEHIFKKFYAETLTYHVGSQPATVLIAQLYHDSAVKIAWVRGLAFQHGSVTKGFISVVASKIKTVM